jgi:hypothetical protein
LFEDAMAVDTRRFLAARLPGLADRTENAPPFGRANS